MLGELPRKEAWALPPAVQAINVVTGVTEGGTHTHHVDPHTGSTTQKMSTHPSSQHPAVIH